jgi:branched-chain amino acid transport system permease protein
VFNVGGVRVTNADIVVLASALVLTFGLIFFVNRTRQGRALRAVADQPEASALLGVNRQAVSRATMFVSGGLAGFAGLLLALQSGTIYYNMGDGLLLTSFAIIILGGIGSVAGALLGSFVLAGCETLATAIGVSQYEQVIVFAMVILVLLVRPSGLFGKTRQVRV